MVQNLRHPERKIDLDNEENIVRDISQVWDVSFTKLPIQYRLDYALLRNDEVMAFAEIKKRTNTISTYSTYMISLSKILASKNLTSVTGKKCFLIVGFTDLTAFVDMDVDYKLKIGGRLDRNDWQDLEPTCHIDIHKFTKLNKRG
tara:strand:- start:395 stop:829 length:435 start_codon:yes stop_codon:yes gene_type:complete